MPTGPATSGINGQTVAFPVVNGVQPKQTQVYIINVQAGRPTPAPPTQPPATGNVPLVPGPGPPPLAPPGTQPPLPAAPLPAGPPP